MVRALMIRGVVRTVLAGAQVGLHLHDRSPVLSFVTMAATSRRNALLGERRAASATPPVAPIGTPGSEADAAADRRVVVGRHHDGAGARLAAAAAAAVLVLVLGLAGRV